MIWWFFSIKCRHINYVYNLSSLDGSQRKVLVDSKIVYPYGITLDLPLKRVYWVDTYLDYIEAVDYDGGNRKTILRGSPVQNLYSASVFENSLYLTSWRNNSILRVNKFQAEWLFNLNRICFRSIICILLLIRKFICFSISFIFIFLYIFFA